LTLLSSIVAANTGPTGPDVTGPVLAGGSDLVGNGAGMTGLANGKAGNLVGTATQRIDPKLAALGYYGGPTQTMALLAGSPALGPAAALTTLTQTATASQTTLTLGNVATVARTRG